MWAFSASFGILPESELTLIGGAQKRNAAGLLALVTVSTQLAPEYLYLTTTGWKSGNPHQIEIWFTELDGRYYLISEPGERAHWVQNLRRNPAVVFRLGSGRQVRGTGRIVEAAREAELAAVVFKLFSAKYDWNEGLIVELCPG
jgi:deazaflavin-dependent oxidoreductase (nitroreductase family)